MALDPRIVLALGGGLGLLLLVIGAIMSLVGRRSVVEERLGQYAEPGTPFAQPTDIAEERSLNPLSEFVNRLGEGTDLYESIAKNLAQANLKLRAGEYLLLMLIAAVVVGVLGAVLGRSIVFGLVSAILGSLIPNMYVKRAQRNRMKAFDNQLSDMLNLMVNGLRAGYSTLMAMEAVGREMPPPISEEFRRVVQEMQLGIPMDDALAHLVRRIRSDDLDMVVTAVNVQREVGGNLAEILDGISHTIRERVRIRGEIMALTAMGRATAWVISLMPVGLMGFLFLANRPYIMQFVNPETRSCGIPMLVTAGIMVIAGFIVVQRIVNIDI